MGVTIKEFGENFILENALPCERIITTRKNGQENRQNVMTLEIKSYQIRYITMKEWTADFGGKKAGTVPEGAGFAPLPFYACSLSMQPFEDPVCTKDGVIYDVTYANHTTFLTFRAISFPG
jgi:hypothetical protein